VHCVTATNPVPVPNVPVGQPRHPALVFSPVVGWYVPVSQRVQVLLSGAAIEADHVPRPQGVQAEELGCAV
jgi:hypothetical protein